MKKFSLIALFFVAIFAACSKDSEPDYHISFTANGVNKKFTGNVLAQIDSVMAYKEIGIFASNSTLDMDNYLGILLNNYPSMKPVTTGAYDDSNKEFTVSSVYGRDAEEFEAGQSVFEDGITYNVPIANHFKLIITAMDKNTVRGTFSGDYYFQGDVQHGEMVRITNGSFNAKFQ